MIKSILRIAAKYLLALGVLGFVVYANWSPTEGRGLGDVWQEHVVNGEPIGWAHLLGAFALHVTGLTTILFRWYFLVRAQDLPFSVLAAMRLGTLGFLFSAFLPGSVGGDVVKAAALARGQTRRTVAVATVIVDRLMSLWGLILMVAGVGSAAWFLGHLEDSTLAPARVVIAACAVIVALSAILWLGMGMFPAEKVVHFGEKFTRVPKIGAALGQLWEAVWLYRNRPTSILGAIGLSMISNVCDVVAFYCYVLTLWDGAADNPLPGLTEHFLMVPVGLVISAVPLFPGGTGIGEAGFGGLYMLFGSAAANGILGSFLFRLSGWIIGIAGYVVFSMFDADNDLPLAV